MTFYLVLGITLGFAASVQPGPFIAYLIAQALSGGWRRALPAAAAPLLSDGPIAVLALVVLTHIPPGFVHWLRVLGGGFVLFLAFGAARTWLRNHSTAPPAASAQRSFLQAATVNFLNPGAYIGWSLVLGPLLLKGWHEAPARGVAVVASFYGTMIATNAGVVLLFHLARGLGPRVNRALIGASALALAALGLCQLWLGLRPG
ncbi:MAG: LysE family transporter [Gemmatimonadales bacterium]